MLVHKRTLIIVTPLAVILLGIASWWAVARITADARADMAEALSAVLETTQQALRSWSKGHGAVAQAWADSPRAVRLTKGLLATPPARDALIKAPVQAQIREWLRPVHSRKEVQGFFIIGPGNVNLASTRDSNLGVRNLLVNQEGVLEKMWSGQTALTLPQRSDVPLPDENGRLREGLPTMFIGSPIRDESGIVIALLTFRLKPSEEFTAILQRGRIGASGETYAFDKRARLISESRFDDQLRRIGLISPDERGILTVAIRDPGVNLVAGETSTVAREQQPLTRMAERAVAGEPGTDLEGYRDYRGVSVIGAWIWDSELGLGITTEIDTVEAYEGLSSTRTVIFALTLFSMLLLIVVTMIFVASRQRVLKGEQSLRESEVRFRSVTQSAPDAVIAADSSGRIISWNKGAEATFGYREEEVLGQPLSLLMPERYREAHRRGLERVRTTGQTRIIGKRLELHGQRKDGGEFPMELSLGTWEARDEIFFGGFLRDITERKQADEALQQKSAFVRLLQIVAVAANEASTVTEAMQTCLDQVCAHTGWPLGHVYVPAADSTGELAPTSIWHLENPEHFETFRKVTEATRFAPGVGLPGRVLASGKAEWIIDVNKAPNFSRSKLAVDIGVKAAFAFPVWAQTEIVAVLEFFSEEAVEPDEPLLEVMAHIGTQLGRVAERKRAETVLRRSEASLADAQRVAHLGNWDWDIVHNELRWSGEIYRIFGLAPQKFGVTYEAFLASVHPDDREFVKKSVNEALYERKPYSVDHRIVLPDGSERIVHEQAEVTLDEAGKPTRMIGTVHDISERKRAEEEIQKLNVELEQRVANRTAELAATIKELEAFTYSVSHDLRAPLRHIDGFSKILLEDFGPGLDSSAQHYLQRIRDGARHMGNLVDDLLNLSRVGRQKLNLQVTGLDSLVEEAQKELESGLEGRQVEWQIGRLPFVECDPNLMKQVFSNLLSNAVKYTRPRERALIHVGQRTVDGQPVVFVRDNGVGFSMKYADKLFGVFQRLHRAEDFEGTGVGLATVQRIIHKHGGRIWAEAELDKGATFYFTLGTAKNSGTEDTSTAIERR